MKNSSFGLRTRVFVSNAIILCLCAFLAVGFAGFAIYGFMFAYDNGKISKNYETGLGFITVYQIQMYVNKIQDDLLQGDPAEMIDDPEVRSFIDGISESGASIAIFKNEDLIYSNGEFTEKEALKSAEEYRLFNKNSSEFFTGSNGSILFSCRPISGGGYSRILFSDNRLNNLIGETNEGMLNNLFDFTVSILVPVSIAALIIILITNLMLSYGMSRDLVNPIYRLSVATKRIRDGDLDYSINYRGDNEIGALCEDFDQMRLQLKESKRLQKAYEDNRRELIAGISHDLGSPLTLIKGYVSGLLDGIADTPEKKDKYLKTILDTACDMDKLVDELFLLSKLETDNFTFDFSQIDISEYFDSKVSDLPMLTGSANIECVFENDCPKGVYVLLDKLQITRVIKNVIHNSVKYNTNENPKLKISLKYYKTYVDLSISDNGPGVASEDLEKIFESFYRTDKARSNSTKSGSGLGLAIAKRIIIGHNGTIKAELNESGGLTIIISLPVHNSIEEVN